MKKSVALPLIRLTPATLLSIKQSTVVMARLLERQRTGQNESRRGRPRLDDSVALTETLSIRVDKGTYGWIHEEVERRKVTMGELVRELFEAARRPA